jgi:hypothetical protein
MSWRCIFIHQLALILFVSRALINTVASAVIICYVHMCDAWGKYENVCAAIDCDCIRHIVGIVYRQYLHLIVRHLWEWEYIGTPM